MRQLIKKMWQKFIQTHQNLRRTSKSSKRNKTVEKLYEYGEQIPIEFVVLKKEHKELAKRFKCGNTYIDSFVRNMSFKDKTTVTRAAIDIKNNNIIAILTLAATGIYTNPSKLSGREKIVISAVEIKDFAVDERYQGLPYSDRLEDDTLSYQIFNKYLKDILELSKTEIGIRKIVLYAVDTAVSFYKRNQFRDFKKYMISLDNREIRNCVPMYFNLNE